MGETCSEFVLWFFVFLTGSELVTFMGKLGKNGCIKLLTNKQEMQKSGL